ncbi:MAG: response regulator [Labilithrix sp.]|nr:response regulator [Labilithrix sp.]MCW5809741.1 response regulator [Labilithrix sp.]
MPPRILLVEDNEMNRDMLARRLSRRGFEVILATTGTEGVAKARAEKPDLVLMDMSLPEIDGWEATRQLRADASCATMRIIALTAHAMAEDRRKATEAGCDDFDTKPVDIERLITKMTALLAQPHGGSAMPQPPAKGA